ncbi:hypothetical protein PanWU01x14_317250 [Parasponia andersonii]|uniref:Uncharacterized protein n=1 Tax=Parasponia andersonii TaxID=3476 RepID=A0A2P5AMN2_PARAD|nr:hypothetical protein PanWU01x14_317250 [Parasponia andersonii]
MSPIDYFESHHLKSTGWRNEYTQEKYAVMVTFRVEVLTQTQARALSEFGDAASSVESVVGPEQVAERVESASSAEECKRTEDCQQRQVAETIATLKQQLAEKDAEHTRWIDETQRQMAEKEAKNQCWLEETQRQLNE